jgi:hypothetical protein
MADNTEHHPKTATGPFYVVDGCCISCGVPHQIAPDLFAWDDNDGTCYFKRQPQTSVEIDKTVRVIGTQDVGCIRYAGNDSEMLRRLAELGGRSQCDVAPPRHIERKFRNHVTFCIGPGTRLRALEVAEALKTYLRSREKELIESLSRSLGSDQLDQYRYRIKDKTNAERTAAFSYSWYENNYHTVEILHLGEADREWLVRHSPTERVGSQAVSVHVHDWLISDGRFCLVRWYAAEDWKAEGSWRSMPW